MDELLAAMAAAVDTAKESFSNSGNSLRGKGHGTINDAVEAEVGRGDEEHTLSSNWANNTSSSSNVVLPDRMEGS